MVGNSSAFVFLLFLLPNSLKRKNEAQLYQPNYSISCHFLYHFLVHHFKKKIKQNPPKKIFHESINETNTSSVFDLTYLLL